jgi:hypothetical protein
LLESLSYQVDPVELLYLESLSRCSYIANRNRRSRISGPDAQTLVLVKLLRSRLLR